MTPRPVAWDAAGRGAVVGIMGLVVFLSLHALLVEPIWKKAWLQGVAVAVVGGGLMGQAYVVLRPSLPVEERWRGAWFGGLVASFLVPFLFAGYARIHAAPVVVVAAVLLAGLALVVVVYVQATRVEEEPVGRGTIKRAAAFFGVVALLNVYPGVFLFHLVAIVPDRVPDPFPMASVLAGVYLLSGTILGWWTDRTAS
ncbi:MAG: hypothetical protein KY455_13105 [Euryarchaeota archaeon]|nr:hypothetical protein [Euryarchaeota archaeon]